MPEIPLAVLDLVPVSDGSTPEAALRNTVDLARRAEGFGYRRYWFAEHHLNPGVLGSSPTVTIALVAGATSTIRLGSAGVQSGHRTPLSVVEEFGLIGALHPGRLDLGIGRSLGRPDPAKAGRGDGGGGDGGGDSGGGGDGGGRAVPAEPALSTAAAAAAIYRSSIGGGAHTADEHTANGLLLPQRFDVTKLINTAKVGTLLDLLQQPGAHTPQYGEQIDEILALLAGTYRSADGVEAHASPGEGAEVEVWILGASGGSSAEVAGARGLRFAASYHHSPSTVLDAVTAYRNAFRPSADLAEPYVSVSADVVVGEDDQRAARLASGYGLWVHSIRSGAGAIPFPTPEQAAAHVWTDEERALVTDRTQTQLVGSPATVADRLEQLQQATGADELAITTITHEHADRVRSYELLATEWRRRQH
ncbi:putative LuxAB-like Oxygenase [Frankia canadensis]|uniref:Putative LuxAB-like Oxygenase n=1 Tax=Frankia canadensis TaxID=1836972 RepID=A0A2I2KZI8_9ACTN|nr:LLM class flavin-dependent oxidoreductase [Frankia canadensis]SNQ51084.1 putative LuxAB-like Oxygenase [Frankia canadensis]SOU58374.1 putative LuxAB-like Oxygenase [Frankia canadensis]